MKTMIAVDEALAMIRACCTPLPSERIALAQAGERVLAEAIDAPRALPPFDNSAMDGFALRWREDLAEGSELAVLAEQAAGDGIAGQSDGACSIMTGARLPDGLDTVVPVEDCTVTARDPAGAALSIRLSITPRSGQHVRHAGEDVATGERVLDAGTRLNQEAVMVLRGIGIGEVDVRRRPRLALACTGRELVDTDGAALAPGQIANTNGPYLAQLFTDAGAEVVERVTVPDEPEALATLLARWLDAGIELVVTTGAVSMGRYDFVPYVLRAAGAELRFHKLKMRPGKPLLFATAGRGTLVFGLPGNPVSSAVGARFHVDAALRALAGQPPETALRLPLAADASKKPGFTMIQKAALVLNAQGQLQVQLLKGQESFKTAPLLRARVWALLPEDASTLPAGTRVPIFPLRPHGASFDGLTQ
ncbi:gephyrin-like molybdotransferase Glp [Thermomonas sp. HDW16]|uniref:molybdopterin molybdotransferase MoeA n=1 Tax=Thermomonas sp. HDW16 TaxID=2714945 RepID=UPI001409D3BE|nr:gephyrin-like molybdotransferase Glp [Thermomonas sp. HDW16]QIL20325.1 molybdopterin molybdotransferase MoeA [Thermomonas sp. HDW16]